ncbi:hypothetical protein FQV27_12560 [Paracoccus aurantiacus]|uniref:Uncharacterized protein n=1 Tax=Paracoccus aurantiacus TaxID=2599412 RepID=A0A5C6S0H0_9RHOB|nr:hypothetical protein [Paracoccus aurantiacus]TXB68021.1 hypothetical protein FQV27_12560 [Paracoccus aurantiacus]
MSLDYNLAPYVPGAMRVEANGQVIDYISSGRNSGGGSYYKSRFSDEMEFRILWYDAAEETAWMSDIMVRGRELSAYDTEREVLGLDIVVGPGADLLVTTPNADALRLMRDDRTDEITTDMRAPVVLRQLCGTSLPLDDPRIDPLVSAAHDPDDSLSRRIARIMTARNEFIGDGGVIQSRCGGRE